MEGRGSRGQLRFPYPESWAAAVGDGEQETWQSSETGPFPGVAGNLLSTPNVGEGKYQPKKAKF